MESKLVRKGGGFARKTVELPRRLKRIISVCTDCLMIPVGTLDRHQSQDRPPRNEFFRLAGLCSCNRRQYPHIYPRRSLPSRNQILGAQSNFRCGPLGRNQRRNSGNCGSAVSNSRSQRECCGDLFRCRAPVCRRIAFCGSLLPFAALPHADGGARGDLWRGRSGRQPIQSPPDHACVRSCEFSSTTTRVCAAALSMA